MSSTSAIGSFDIGLGLEDTHVVVTGGAGMIGTVVVTAFLKAGAYVSVFDLVPTELQHERLDVQIVDITDERGLVSAFEKQESSLA